MHDFKVSDGNGALLTLTTSNEKRKRRKEEVVDGSSKSAGFRVDIDSQQTCFQIFCIFSPTQTGLAFLIFSAASAL